MVELFFMLLVGHALCDYPLQGDFLSRHKHWSYDRDWWIYMLAHCLIQGGMVWFVTGSLLAGVLELFLHYLIDCAKNQGWTGIWMDQFLHVACKLVYAVALCL
jgi:hypothetical protein